VKQKSFIGILVLLSVIVFSGSVYSEELIGLRYPALSGDGSMIAFSYMGDIWVVSSKGGDARRITDHIAYDYKPLWTPDGKQLVFTSNRNGNDDIYVIDSEGGVPRRLTYHSAGDVGNDITADGKWVIFHSSRSSSSSLFKISLQGGNAYPILDTYWSWPYYADLSPDGQEYVFSLGMENGYWWRRGYRGSNTSEIWRKGFEKDQAELVISDQSNCFWPQWGHSGGKIYFVSDREYNNKNIWSVGKDGTGLTPVTHFKEGDIKWLSIADDAALSVYERDFGLWITDLEKGESHPVAINAPSETKNSRTFHYKEASVSEYKISPDGKKIAAVVRGDIFVMASKGGFARNVTRTPWREKQISWDKDSRLLAYVCDKNADPDIYLVSALGDGEPELLVSSPEDELLPTFSPDGKWIAYYRGKKQIRLISPDKKDDHLLIEGDFGGRFGDAFVWSPDSAFLAVVPQKNSHTDIFAVDINSKQKILLTDTAYDEGSPYWSQDCKFMLFSSNRFGHSFPEFTGKWDIYRVDFAPEKPEFKEDKFEELFETEDKEEEGKKDKEKKDKEEPKVVFDMEDRERQTKRITNSLGDDSAFVISPVDVETVYFVSNTDGTYHLWKTSLKEEERGKFEPFLPAIRYPRSLQCRKGGEYLYYLSSGSIGRINLKTSKSERVSFDVDIKVDKVDEYEQMLGEVYYTLKHYYYDEKLHNVDWDGLYEKFKPVLQQVREDRDFYDYANEMIGYLNSSHTGIRGTMGARTEEPSAHVGAEWDFAEGKVFLKRIIKDGPLYFYREEISQGDELASINGESVKPEENIWKLFNGKIGKRVVLGFKKDKTGEEKKVSVEPISAGQENRLVLEEWIDSRRDYVKKNTDDDVAYIYMRAMGGGDLERFLRELERDAVPRKGLILDLRYNFGGNVHDRVLQALTKPVYAKWKMRGLSETPQSSFGFEDKPIVLLVNEVTLSDGEMTANGFKALERGPVIGNTTYGWLIFTTGAGLMNGAYFRLPFWGCYTLDGQDLETSGGVKPDIEVVNDLNDELNGTDPQLEKAISVIKDFIKEKK